jgi:hypothetical protein
MVWGWEYIDIFVFYSLIKWSHCVTFSRLFYLSSNIVIFCRNHSLYLWIGKFLGITKFMRSRTKNRIFMINIIFSNSRILPPIPIRQRPIRTIKIILRPKNTHNISYLLNLSLSYKLFSIS